MNIAKNIQLTSTTVICVETKVKAQLSEVKARAGENLRTVSTFINFNIVLGSS